ncbi:protein-disulfide reductase DsbD family protein [Galbibacter sp. EGI 63066]|uniref:protein-disulfide reductase DsbD domain-containing protein n=1 Tax=Galbibacter sp. EGI 63066 TaxID=2993559 RepID=UPI002248FC00|nr:protein-disulfide reductase DsbD domain-containing protein [Galbibacter sp. EGI 63066]MCX2680976.1 protein-disulfide reductase DsbD family protein [Galbibacter sp. EGI 63066]
MKKILLALLLLIPIWGLSSQVLEPVQWDFTCEKTGDKTYRVYLTALMEPGWHIYSQYMEEGGPIPTAIVFKENPVITSKGKIKEVGDRQEVYEEVFMVQTNYYEGKVDFVREVQIKKGEPVTLKGTVTYMACSGDLCLPPEEVAFEIVLR